MNKTLTIIIIALAIILGSVYIKQQNTIKEKQNTNFGIQDSQAFTGVSRFQNQSGVLDQIKSYGGVLGNVTITGAGAGTFEIYDASTTNASLRVPQATSSLRVLASFPTNATAGTYTFNQAFSTGLIVSFIGTVPTTTITYR